MPASSPPTVLCAPEIQREAVAMARAALPNEACGLVAGVQPIDWRESGRVEILGVIPVRNTLASPTAFVLDGQEMIDAEDRIDAASQTMIGVHHSHPTSQACPSRRDVADAVQYDPERRFVHLITSLQGFVPTVRAWRYGTTLDDCIELAIIGSVG